MDTDLLRSIRGRLEAASDPHASSGRRLFDADMAHRLLDSFEASLPATRAELADLGATLRRLTVATVANIHRIDQSGDEMARVLSHNARITNVHTTSIVRLLAATTPLRLIEPSLRRRVRDQLTWARRPRVGY